MCGFCGFTGELIKSDEVLTNMMNKIIHRGPDSAGKHIDSDVALGFRRLSIIDLDNGSQPMLFLLTVKFITIRKYVRILLKKAMFSETMPIRKFLSTDTKNTEKTFLIN